MNTSPDPIARLVRELGRLPGIGERSATRLAFYIIKSSQGDSHPLARDLAAALVDAVERVGFCQTCQNLCAGRLCSICSDTRRDPGLLCVVESVPDLSALEASGAFHGTYHVLHGVLAPLDGIGPDDLKLDALLHRLSSGDTREVILATNADVEGDTTALYLTQLIRPLGIKTTRLASGVPLGGELEYVDQATLNRALRERREV